MDEKNLLPHRILFRGNSDLTSIHALEKKEDVLRMWHIMDPPDIWEMDRNSLIEQKQGNRNPFIDHPELVERVRDF